MSPHYSSRHTPRLTPDIKFLWKHNSFTQSLVFKVKVILTINVQDLVEPSGCLVLFKTHRGSPTLCFIHLYCFYLVHQIVGAPLGDLLGKHLLVVRKVLCVIYRNVGYYQRYKAMSQLQVSNTYRQDFTTLETYHSSNYSMFYCGNHKVNRSDTVSLLQSDQPSGTCDCVLHFLIHG